MEDVVPNELSEKPPTMQTQRSQTIGVKTVLLFWEKNKKSGWMMAARSRRANFRSLRTTLCLKKVGSTVMSVTHGFIKSVPCSMGGRTRILPVIDAQIVS